VAKAVSQIANLRVKLGQGGHQEISHPRGGHDDIAAAVSGLVMLLTPVEGAPMNVGNILESIARGDMGVVRRPRVMPGYDNTADTETAWLNSQGKTKPGVPFGDRANHRLPMGT
jgi:hypothetical protein